MADELTSTSRSASPAASVVSAAFRVELRRGLDPRALRPLGLGQDDRDSARVAGLERPERGHDSLRPRRGSTRRDGLRRAAAAPRRVRVPGAALFPHLTVRANVEYGLARSRRQPTAPASRRVLELVRRGDLADRYPRELSGGQAQRVALARALAPSAAAPPARRAVRVARRARRGRAAPARARVLRALGIAAMLVTHDRTEALALGDHIAVLAGARVRQVGPVPTSSGARPISSWRDRRGRIGVAGARRSASRRPGELRVGATDSSARWTSAWIRARYTPASARKT